MKTDAQKKAEMKYRKNNVKTITLSFYVSDMDLYNNIQQAAANTGESAPAYVKRVMREHLDKLQA